MVDSITWVQVLQASNFLAIMSLENLAGDNVLKWLEGKVLEVVYQILRWKMYYMGSLKKCIDKNVLHGQ